MDEIPYRPILWHETDQAAREAAKGAIITIVEQAYQKGQRPVVTGPMLAAYWLDDTERPQDWLKERGYALARVPSRDMYEIIPADHPSIAEVAL